MQCKNPARYLRPRHAHCKNSAGEDFYGPYDAQDLFRELQEEIGIEMVDFKHMVYVQERAQYEPNDEIEDKDKVTILNISGTELRRPSAGFPRWGTGEAAREAYLSRSSHWCLKRRLAMAV